MRPFQTIARATVDGGRELTLHHRDGDHFIHLDGEELMSSCRHGSESALAELALAGVRAGGSPTILIGGLGLGFTLRAALDVLPSAARVMVAEIFPAVVGWHRHELAHLGTPIDDPRVRVREADVTTVLIESRQDPWTAILLDVDNGPSAFCLESNARLYDPRGIDLIRSALEPDGVLGIWSAYRDAGFVKRLGKAGFHTRVATARAKGGKGQRGFVVLARKR